MIYTFYSYKGGVGRSMALANLAEWFYEQGLRVVMIDWDLEAPGLESFFVSEDQIEKVRAKPGLLDMLLAYKDQYPLLPLTVTPTLAFAAAATGESVVDRETNSIDSEKTKPGIPSWDGARMSRLGRESRELSSTPEKLDTLSAVEVLEEHLPPLEYFLYPIRPTGRKGQKGALWLLSAGWRTKDRFSEYGRAVQNFSWSEFYDAYHGEAYFEWMRKQLNSPGIADVVLIDSRTGLTEMGGVCTRQLADVVVSFTAPNVQNLNGVISMTASFKKKEVIEARNKLEYGGAKRTLEVILVPTRIDESESDEKKVFEREFTQQLNEYPASFRRLKHTFWDLLIPYIPKYAYREKLAIGDELGNDTLIKAYKNLAAHLVLLAPEGGVIRAHFADELRERFGRMLPRVLLVEDGQGENADPWRLRRRLKEAGLSLWDKPGEGSQAIDSAQQTIGNIDLAEFLVMPVTPEGVWSGTFQRQWRYARQLGVCVHLVRGDPEVELTQDDLPLWLRDTHIYDPATELDSLIELLKRPCITSRVPFMAPDLPESYVPRPLESEKLKEALLNSKPKSALTEAEQSGESSTSGSPGTSAAAVKVALCGPAGCGKTALATAACIDDSVIAAFSDGILWVTLRERSEASIDLNLLYSALTGEGGLSSQVDIERILAPKLEGKKCLLVVNDVCDETDLRPFLNLLTTGALLFTTRDQTLAASAGATRLVVGEMSAAESLNLLVKHSRIPAGHEAALNQIVENLGNMPLPIKLAGATLRQRLSLGNNPGEAVRTVVDETAAHGVVAFDQRNATDRDLSVAKSIAASLDRLSDQEKSCFLKLGVLAPETDTGLDELGFLWGQVESESKNLALRLASLSLLDYDSGKGTVRLHRLMHAFLVAQRADPSILSAIVERAENVFSSLTPGEQLVAQRVFARLVHLSGPEDKLADTRRSYDLEKFGESARPIIETLRKAELLTVAGGAIGERSTVQIADDSLVQGWNRLQAWLDADRAFLTWRQTLEPNIGEWEGSKRHNRDVLLAGKGLAVARAWLSDRPDDLNETEKLFIIESRRTEVKRNSTLRRAAAVIFVTVVILLTSAVYFHYRTIEKQKNALKALSDTRIDQNTNAPAEQSEASYRKAIAAYNKVIQDNPQFAEAYDGRGSAYSGLGDYENAEKDFRQAVSLSPDYAQAWNDLGTVLKLKGDKSEPSHARVFFDQAIDAFNQAIKLKPDYVDAYFGRGDTYMSKGDRIDKANFASYDLAIADYTRISAQLQRDKPTADAYYKRGLAYKSKGDNSNALADFQKASELPGDVYTRENILKNLQQLKASSSAPLFPATPSIFIQYNDPDDEDAIKQVAKDLKSKGLRVVGQPQLSGGTAIGDGDVRCFNSSDLSNATEIAKAVQESLRGQNYDKNIIARDLTGYPNVPPGQIEVWVASLRISSIKQ